MVLYGVLSHGLSVVQTSLQLPGSGGLSASFSWVAGTADTLGFNKNQLVTRSTGLDDYRVLC